MVICPFKSLVKQVHDRATELGIAHIIWQSASDWQFNNPVPLIIVSGNACYLTKFIEYVNLFYFYFQILTYKFIL